MFIVSTKYKKVETKSTQIVGSFIDAQTIKEIQEQHPEVENVVIFPLCALTVPERE